MNDKFLHIDWDTNVFGYKVARILPPNLADNDLNDLLSALKKKGYRLVYWVVDGGVEKTVVNDGNCHDIRKHKIINLRKSIADALDKDFASSNVVQFVSSSSNNKIVRLAYQSGEYSRYHLDPNFRSNEFRKLYSLWLKNAVNGTYDKEVWTYSDKRDICGLITLGESSSALRIGLIAVDRPYRGRSIAKELIAKACERASVLGFQDVDVATQPGNRIAVQLYKSIGFEEKNLQCIYHFWLQ